MKKIEVREVHTTYTLDELAQILAEKNIQDLPGSPQIAVELESTGGHTPSWIVTLIQRHVKEIE